jgi:hypothetical protein
LVEAEKGVERILRQAQDDLVGWLRMIWLDWWRNKKYLPLSTNNLFTLRLSKGALAP